MGRDLAADPAPIRVTGADPVPEAGEQVAGEEHLQQQRRQRKEARVPRKRIVDEIGDAVDVVEPEQLGHAQDAEVLDEARLRGPGRTLPLSVKGRHAHTRQSSFEAIDYGVSGLGVGT